MQRRHIMLAAGAAAFGAACSGKQAATGAAAAGRTFLVAHGAWSAGWSWKRMHPLMNGAGRRFIVPTYTGLGERAHLASPDVNLETHVQDLLGVIRYEELTDLVLVAHSYGGMVATALADRVPDRIRQIIYVDAFVPRDGQSLFDLAGVEARERLLAGMREGDGWRLPPMPIPEDTSPEDVEWISQYRIPQPVHCFDTPVRLANGEPAMPRAYVYALRHPPADTFGPFAQRAKDEGWVYHGIDASHSAQVTAPDALASLLLTIAG